TTAGPPLLSATTITAEPPATVPFADGLLQLQSSNPELSKQRHEEMRRRLLANGGPLPGSLDWVLGIPSERRSGISINTISAAGEASSAVARLGYHVKFNDVISLKVTNKPAPPRRKKTAGTTSHPEEERLSDLPRLSNPYLEKRRRTFMMALSSGHFLILISFLVIFISFSQYIFYR
ncbi:hypothetical protein Tco_1580801, partial [Tanacetum coccineum]